MQSSIYEADWLIRLAGTMLLLSILASRCCAEDIDWLAGLDDPVTVSAPATRGKAESRFGVHGHRYSDGLWRADLDRLEPWQLEFYAAVNERHLDGTKRYTVWRPPHWDGSAGGWRRGKTWVRYVPEQFARAVRVLCEGRSCRRVNTWTW